MRVSFVFFLLLQLPFYLFFVFSSSALRCFCCRACWLNCIPPAPPSSSPLPLSFPRSFPLPCGDLDHRLPPSYKTALAPRRRPALAGPRRHLRRHPRHGRQRRDSRKPSDLGQGSSIQRSAQGRGARGAGAQQKRTQALSRWVFSLGAASPPPPPLPRSVVEREPRPASRALRSASEESAGA